MAADSALPALSALVGRPSWDDDQTSVFLAVLEPFSFDGSRSEIADGVMIKRITQVDRERLEERSHAFLVGLNRFAVQCKQGAGRKQTVEEKTRENLDRIVLALRILQPGPIELGAIVAYQPNVAASAHDPWSLSGWPSRSPLVNPLGLRGQYKLSKADTAQLKKLYRGLQADLGRRVNIALRRFDLTYQRRRSEDRLIDCWVGLEALFSDGSTEITYKLAMRIAHFIGQSPDERAGLYKELKRAYNARSDVVHGRGAERRIRETEALSDGTLRSSLRQVLLDGKTPEPASIDDSIARGR